ncbi:unnamed protein product [Gongylonema pulchrum]|uniref:HMA domain-containing protein n=1 Tax=Gongylonema pulchrum TaxID=637853 RepID=A0A183ESL9_9BILA|nr:unnamed protein product [Gongylonema pulchrum]
MKNDDVLLLFASDIEVSDDTSSKLREAVIEINGMTCHSCVNNIEESIGRNEGIKSISVSLIDREDYSEESTKRPSLSILHKKKGDWDWTDEKCSIRLGEKSAKFKPSKEDSIEKRTFSVDGMTCVQTVVVALMSGKAEVVYDSLMISAEQIASEIDQLGYRASIIGGGLSSHNVLNLLVSDIHS